jgi:cytochrome c biogenesis factor
MLAFFIGGALRCYAWRARSLTRAGGLFAPISREGALVLNNLLLSTAVRRDGAGRHALPAAVQRRQVAETAIHTNLLRDLYATLGEGEPAAGLDVIRLYLEPARPLDLARRRRCARWAASSR